MQVVLFCGGLGTRIREYSEAVPKPMIPVGHRPILWHLMKSYSQHGHNDFLLCLGFKGDVIKNFFLRQRPEDSNDCIVSEGGRKIELIGQPEEAWRVTLIDTGMWRSVGERLWAVRHHIHDEIFLANYSDGLSDVDLGPMIQHFRASRKVACFLAVHPPLLYHLAQFDERGAVRSLKTANTSDLWINGGFFVFRREIFDYMRDGEDLVVEPFERLIREGKLMAYRHEGFWQSMDNMKDRQIFEDLILSGRTPWLLDPVDRDPSTVRVVAS